MENESMKQHLIECLQRGVRYDGRKLNEFRSVVVERAISCNAEGSARVKLGKTEVVAGVKLIIEKPYPDTPDQGSLMVNAEFLPLSSPNFESGPPGMPAIETARVVDRGIRESKAIDVSKLCIAVGEKIWMVSIDICTINDDGNILDAAGLASLAALKDACFPHYDGTELDYKKKTNKKLPLDKYPLPITVYKIGKVLLVDPSPEEEEVCDARLTVTTTMDGELCALQKGGDQPLSISEIGTMIDFALDKAKQLRGLFI